MNLGEKRIPEGDVEAFMLLLATSHWVVCARCFGFRHIRFWVNVRLRTRTRHKGDSSHAKIDR